MYRDDLVNLESADVIDAVVAAFGSDGPSVVARNFRCPHDDDFQVDLLCDNRVVEVAPGEHLYWGLRLRHSWPGSHATTIEGYIFRLKSRAGFTTSDCVDRPRSRPRTRRLERSHTDAVQQQCAQITRLAEQTLNSAKKQLPLIRSLPERPYSFDNLKPFLLQSRLYSESLMNRLRRAWVKEGSENTAFGVVKALIRVAMFDPDLSEHQRIRLEHVAGVLAVHTDNICEHCHSVVKK